MNLDIRAARALTDRECVKIIGGLLGPLVQMSGSETVRRAVRWIADHPELFEVMLTPEEAEAIARAKLAGVRR